MKRLLGDISKSLTIVALNSERKSVGTYVV